MAEHHNFHAIMFEAGYSGTRELYQARWVVSDIETREEVFRGSDREALEWIREQKLSGYMKRILHAGYGGYALWSGVREGTFMGCLLRPAPWVGMMTGTNLFGIAESPQEATQQLADWAQAHPFHPFTGEET